MSPSPTRSAWITLALFALAAWLITSLADNGAIADAQPTLRTPRLSAQFVALQEEDEDEHDDDEHEEGDEEDEEGEEDFDEMIEDLEIERAHLELRQADLQATFGELELVKEFVSIAEDSEKSAALAVMAASDSMEPGELIPFLEEVMQKTSSGTVRRVVRMQLAEAYDYADQPAKAMEQIRALALGQ